MQKFVTFWTLLLFMKNDQQRRKIGKVEHEPHLRRRTATRRNSGDFTQQAKLNSEEVHVISVILQQKLPAPKLTTRPEFCLRKLWTYNVGIHIHDWGAENGFMLYGMNVLQRNSDEVGNCVMKYIEDKQPKAPKLVAHMQVFHKDYDVTFETFVTPFSLLQNWRATGLKIRRGIPLYPWHPCIGEDCWISNQYPRS